MSKAIESKSITLALTGASGAPYALRLLELLLRAEYSVHLMISSAARVVLATEQQLKLSGKPTEQVRQLREYLDVHSGELFAYGKDEWFSPAASGSGAPKQMVILPCSTGTLSAVACGASDNLIERAADVVLKERGQLIMVVREMPLSAIHLENMLKLARLGVTLMPAAPGFYHQPQRIEDLINFVVARVLDHLGAEQTIMQRWGYGGESR